MCKLMYKYYHIVTPYNLVEICRSFRRTFNRHLYFLLKMGEIYLSAKFINSYQAIPYHVQERSIIVKCSVLTSFGLSVKHHFSCAA
jgi:hypothetical protein